MAPIPEQFVTPDMVTPDRVIEVINRGLAVQLKEGDVLMYSATCAVTR